MLSEDPVREEVGNFGDLKQKPIKEINKVMFMLEELRDEINSAADPGGLANVGVMIAATFWQNAECMIEVHRWMEPFGILALENQEEYSKLPW